MRSRRRSRTTKRRMHRCRAAPHRNKGRNRAMAVVLSESAAKQVKELKVQQNLPETAFLRMGVRGGGCSGMSYVLEFETDGVKIVIDKKSYIYLNGTTLDYVTQGLTGGFTFVNPSAKSSCGCGTSFSA